MKSCNKAVYNTQKIRSIELAYAGQNLSEAKSLMQQAGLKLFEIFQERWPMAKNLVIVCGRGNNAGDGLVFASLALGSGFRVEVVSPFNLSNLDGEAGRHFRNYQQLGGRVLDADAYDFNQTDLIVDALFGIGLNRSLSTDLCVLIDRINQSGVPILSVDIPSGLNADTGDTWGNTIEAAVTVTFIGLKPGLVTGFASDYCGEIICDDLGISSDLLQSVTSSFFLLEKTPLTPRKPSSHKGHYGHVLVLGGNHGYLGAVCLAAMAAMRTGAGLVSVGTRSEHSRLIPMMMPELMSHATEHPSDLVNLLDRCDTIVIGPGLGLDGWAQMIWSEAIAVGKPMIVDADALTLLSRFPIHSDHWVLTPHPGEAGRLLGQSTRKISEDRYSAVERLQSKYGGVCVLKGAGSLISSNHECAICPTGNPSMATAGMGDVLAGICGAFVAQDKDLFRAVCKAVYLHGETADYLIQSRGRFGLIASDVIHALPHCMNKP